MNHVEVIKLLLGDSRTKVNAENASGKRAIDIVLEKENVFGNAISPTIRLFADHIPNFEDYLADARKKFQNIEAKRECDEKVRQLVTSNSPRKNQDSALSDEDIDDIAMGFLEADPREFKGLGI